MKIPIDQVSPYLRSGRPSSAQADSGHGSGVSGNPNVRSRDGPTYQLVDRVVPLHEASVITGLSVDTLKRCGKREEIKIIRLSPRRIDIRLSDLWAFIDARAD
jgi:hypothetical protein